MSGHEGSYVVIEGSDGTGKSLQIELLAHHLEATGIETIQFHEPDGVEIASELRAIIKNGTLGRSALTNVLLFTAARRENWLQQGKAALDRGAWVLSSRDHTSTDVYQGMGEGVDREFIRMLTQVAVDERYYHPDLKLILDLNNEAERHRRIAERGALAVPDAFESRDETFQRSVREGYRTIAAEQQLPIIDAAQSREAVHHEVLRYIQPLLR